jgi:perosamine synthetase
VRVEPPAPIASPRPLRVAEPVLDGDDARAVQDVLRSGWVSGYGPAVARFEEAFAAWCGARHGVATPNGTTALHLALAAAGVGAGDEVVVPAFTMAAVAFAVHAAGARAVLCDSDPVSWNLSPAAVAAAVGPRTRAVVAVHTYGLPCDMDALRAATRARGVALVEDAAEAHGATLDGRRAGTLGDVAAFSFFSNKVVTCGEGGMVVTDDPDLADRARRLHDLARTPGAPAYRHDGYGVNYRMSALCAALGASQQSKADRFLARRRRTAATYEARLGRVPGLSFRARSSRAQGSDWMTCVLVDPAFGEDRDALAKHLAAEGIETRPAFHPLNRQPLADRSGGGTFPVADRLGATGLLLPSGNDLSDEDVDRVCRAVVGRREGGNR